MDLIPVGSPAAKYRRCSTDQQANSIPDQGKIIDRIADEFQLDMRYDFIDDGISGSTLAARDGLQDLLARAKSLGIKYLLIQDPSRLSRGGQVDFWEVIRLLKLAKIKVYSCQHRLFVTEENGAIFGLEAAYARKHNVALSYNITRSLIETVHTRKSDPGRVPPYGYDRMRYSERGEPMELVRYYPDGTKAVLDPGTLAVRMRLAKSVPLPKIKSQPVKLVPGDPEQVATLRRIFTLIQATGFTGVADRLNRDGVPGPRGNLWAASTIRDIVLNPVYVGEVTYGRTFKAKYHRVRKDRMEGFDFLEEGELNRGDVPKEDWYRDEGRHEALISRAEWNRAQAVLEKRSHQSTQKTRSPNHVYILSGIARCSRCNGTLHGHTQRGHKGEIYLRYACSTARKNGVSRCARYSVDGPEFERRVLDEVQYYFTRSESRKALRAGLERLLDDRERGRGRTAAKRKELSALEAKKQTVFDSLTREHLPLFRKQIEQMQTDERRLRQELAELERAEGVREDRTVFIERAMRYFEDHILTLRGGCEKMLRESLQALGTEVYWDPDNEEGGLRIYPFGHSAAK